MSSTTEHARDLFAAPIRGVDRSANGAGRAVALGAAACGLALAATYAANLRHFVYAWSTDDNYTHGFLVPLMSLYFAREALRRGPLEPGGGAVIGSALLVVSVLARLATVVVPVGIVGDLGFIAGVAGICALVAGRDASRRFAFAIGFLVFMVPLPVALYTTLASPLQALVSRVGSQILDLIGIPVLREGNLMTLPGGVRMFVAEACSGMRMLTGFLALTTAVAFLSSRPAWYRAVLVLSSVPIALTANVLRVTLTGWIMFRLGPEYATGSFHTAEGLLLMGVALAMLGAECAALSALCGESKEAGR